MSSMSEIELERTYVIHLRDAYEASRSRRAKRAVNIVREFAERHMKAEVVKISSGVNSLLWSRGIEKPPRRLKVIMRKSKDGVVEVLLPEEAEKKEEEK
ncbi:MAG: 60S ribosomal protein L31 [Aigarchaeota archaeon]|nr:60S ribosomal protein L31 [Aigarchaeota archaeon]MDW7986840.1 50S ribosomal protein L31e [Nitrososphaerota archaeon]